MSDIRFLDRNGKAWETMTWEEAAKLVEDEGRLGFGEYIDIDGLRCFQGVLGKYTLVEGVMVRGRWVQSGVLIGPTIAAVNDLDPDETPEDRCKRMTAWLREQGRAE